MDNQSSQVAPSATAESRYTMLSTFRDPFLNRAWDCAEVTIPSLLPRRGTTGSTELPTPWQSLGAQCVNALAAKLLMTGFPANTPMFRMLIDEIVLDRYQVQDDQKTKLETALSKFERAVMTEIEKSGDRAAIFELIKHLLTTGNVLVHKSPLGLRVYHLNNYVVRRDPSGNPLEIIAHEDIDRVVLPDDVRNAIDKDEKNKDHKTISLYTRMVRNEKNWQVYQETCGITITGTQGTYPMGFMPWLPLRMTRVDGEDYGRGYVEEYLGDFMALESLCRAVIEGAQASAKLLFMVNPNGTTQQKDLEESENGAIISGIRDEVGTLQAEKAADFAVAEQQIARLEDRLGRAFLLNSSVQRDAERVTAEEIRYMAADLETSLGGFYTLFAQEFQLPYVELTINRMQKERRLPQLPKGIVNPTIITGVEALGRGNDRTKLVNYVMTLSQAFGPDGLGMINKSEFAARLAASDGIDTKDLVLSQDQLDAQAQAQRQQAMVQQLGPHVINAGGKLMQEGMKQQQQPQEQGGQ